MRGSFKIAEVQGISINVHVTFLILVLIFGKWFFFVLAVFFFVLLHELAHSLVAKKFGITVKEITLLPIGGVASMAKMPEKPYQEFLISLAGPMTNIAIVIIFYVPMLLYVGSETLFSALKYFFTGTAFVPSAKFVISQIYWINLILAAFNLLPAFPMDGGRILRSLLANKFGFRKATKIAVNFGHIFAILFGYVGLVSGRFLLLIIAVFIYMAASSEEMQVDIRSRLKKIRIKDILKPDFITINVDATISKVLELIFHSKQEDFPVLDASGKMIGFVTRQDVIHGIHKFGVEAKVDCCMKKDVQTVNDTTTLDQVQNIFQEGQIRVLPVKKGEHIVGIITSEDISRAYAILQDKK